MARSGVNAQITKLQEETGFPVFLVAFRHSTAVAELTSTSVADGTFVLASGGQGKTEDIRYPGVLQELVDAVEGTVDAMLD